MVDDSVELRDYFRFVLGEAGYDVITASSGQEGFEKTKTLRPTWSCSTSSCQELGMGSRS